MNCSKIFSNIDKITRKPLPMGLRCNLPLLAGPPARGCLRAEVDQKILDPLYNPSEIYKYVKYYKSNI